jgi:hypothetical protein
MKSVKSAVTLIAAVLGGMVLGMFLSRPPSVKAVSTPYIINVQKVQEGDTVKSMTAGSRFLGFACTQQDCYIATTGE